MQLEQQENFTIHGPQLEILGEVETKLPAPAKKRGTASIVLAALALLSVLGIGGAKLKGVYRETAEIYTSAQDEYGHSIQGDFEAQADAAANLIKQAGTQRALDDQYNAFVSAQATIERAANEYNLSVEDYEKTVSQFPANLISGLWGAQAPERFATK